MTLINMNVEAVRRAAIQIGYDAFHASAFVANPYLPGDTMYDHWADGYWLGVEQARIEMAVHMGMTPPANDN